ncbi:MULTISPECIES: hypothetical protein [unclassified Stenotrophomonas]|uniref:hypothetical protein n=1 Tax=unclassified Stenotrophomonas TaxID=196198 RepID=UPI00249CBF68|nr:MULTISPECIES: hypothetical protein [unclassified Stenotrophomonas]
MSRSDQVIEPAVAVPDRQIGRMRYRCRKLGGDHTTMGDAQARLDRIVDMAERSRMRS